MSLLVLLCGEVGLTKVYTAGKVVQHTDERPLEGGVRFAV